MSCGQKEYQMSPWGIIRGPEGWAVPLTTHVMWLDLLAPLLTTLSGWKLLHSPWGLTGLLLSPLQPHVLSSTLPSVPSAQPCSLLPVSEICQATLTSGPLQLLFLILPSPKPIPKPHFCRLQEVLCEWVGSEEGRREGRRKKEKKRGRKEWRGECCRRIEKERSSATWG